MRSDCERNKTGCIDDKLAIRASISYIGTKVKAKAKAKMSTPVASTSESSGLKAARHSIMATTRQVGQIHTGYSLEGGVAMVSMTPRHPSTHRDCAFACQSADDSHDILALQDFELLWAHSVIAVGSMYINHERRCRTDDTCAIVVAV